MYIYNVTINVEESIHQKWLKWMKEEHIPAVLSTGKFLSAKLTKVLVEEDMGGVTYSVQYTVVSKEVLEQYYQQDAAALREEANNYFAGQFVAFRTELEVVDEYFARPSSATHYLFSYGTLQEKEIQLSVFTRPLVGVNDVLTSYRIADQKIAGLYPTLEKTDTTEDCVKGKVYTLSQQELIKADAYEGDAYQRIQIVLASGKKAWAYMAT